MNQNYGIRFLVKKSKAKNGKAPIYCRITVNSKSVDISMKKSIEPDRWSNSIGSIKGTPQEKRVLNTRLDQFKLEIDKTFNQMALANEIITAETLKNNLLGIKVNIEKTLIETFQYHNDQMKERIGHGFVKATHTKFETVCKKLKLYLKTKYKRTDIFLNELDHRFVVDFEHFLKVNEKIANNTTMKYISNLKKVIHLAVSNDWMKKDPFSNFKCTKTNVVREILTSEELNLLHEKEFAIERLAEVRDIFLFCCYTGYAFVDVEKLTPNEIGLGMDGKKWIYTRRQKTGTQANVPLLPPALEILEKYTNHPYCVMLNKLLPVKSNQKMNAYLKEIADLCGITKNLSMHIARHTFATTVTLSNGVPIETVSKLLGHTKLATTQIYAKVLENKVSADMAALSDKLFQNNRLNKQKAAN